MTTAPSTTTNADGIPANPLAQEGGQSLEEIEAIRRLKARYFRYLDTKDWEQFGEVFAQDVFADTTSSGGQRVTGRDQVVAFIRKSVSARATVHHGHMPEIELTSPTTATGVWAMEDRVCVLPGVRLQGYGHYLETYDKSDGHWRIKTMTLTRLWQDFATSFFTFHVGPRTQRMIQRAGERLSERNSSSAEDGIA
jgi:uncharacterized protein (TIGR02246 family)